MLFLDLIAHKYNTQPCFSIIPFCSSFPQAETQLKKIDEIRLLESRKSARLVNSDTDFSKLADVNISPSSNGFSPSSNSSRDQSRKTAGARAIAVPDRRTDYVQIAG